MISNDRKGHPYALLFGAIHVGNGYDRSAVHTQNDRRFPAQWNQSQVTAVIASPPGRGNLLENDSGRYDSTEDCRVASLLAMTAVVGSPFFCLSSVINQAGRRFLTPPYRYKKSASFEADSSFLRIRLLDICSFHKIVHTDTIEVGQLADSIQRIIQNTDLILGIGVLLDIQILRHLFLCQTSVDPQIADPLVFHHFIAHSYHPL